MFYLRQYILRCDAQYNIIHIIRMPQLKITQYKEMNVDWQLTISALVTGYQLHQIPEHRYACGCSVSHFLVSFPNTDRFYMGTARLCNLHYLRHTMACSIPSRQLIWSSAIYNWRIWNVLKQHQDMRWVQWLNFYDEQDERITRHVPPRALHGLFFLELYNPTDKPEYKPFDVVVTERGIKIFVSDSYWLSLHGQQTSPPTQEKKILLFTTEGGVRVVPSLDKQTIELLPTQYQSCGKQIIDILGTLSVTKE